MASAIMSAVCLSHNWFPSLEARVADIEWKPLPAGLWTLPAVFMEAGNLLLEAFMEAGVPTWKVREKTSDPLKWNMIAEGTALRGG